MLVALGYWGQWCWRELWRIEENSADLQGWKTQMNTGLASDPYRSLFTRPLK